MVFGKGYIMNEPLTPKEKARQYNQVYGTMAISVIDEIIYHNANSTQIEYFKEVKTELLKISKV